MEEKDIKTVKTTRGELRYYRDWGNYDGGVVMLNAQTIDRYKAIKNGSFRYKGRTCGILQVLR